MVDLLIKNGLIIDGTGNPGFYGTVVVEGDTLRILRGDVSGIEAGRVIDAADHVVCPGFIDLHSHAGLTMLREPENEPKLRQGVTTELIGIDGNSAAPFKTREDLEAFIEMDSGLNDVMPAGRDWRSVDDFLSMYQKTVSPNIAFIVGNSPVRIWSMGWNNRPASGEDLEDMKAVLRETMEEGSFGLSTGLDYPPGAYADTNELIELSKVVAEKGGFYHTHTRAQLRRISHLAPFEEAVEIGRGSGVPVHLTHYRQPAQGTGTHFDYLGLVEDSRDEGIDVTFDCYTYVFSGTKILIEVPNWAKDGGPEPLKENLRSDEAEEAYEGGHALRAKGNEHGRDVAHRVPQAGQRQIRWPLAGGNRQNEGAGSAGHAVRSTARRGPGRIVRGGGDQPANASRFCGAPPWHGGQRRYPVWGVAQPAHIRVLPGCSGRVCTR